MNNEEILEQIKGKLIVSCQALPEEPLHSSYIMSRMAYAAMKGGAGGIRCNTVEDIKEIKKTAALPLIGIIKAVYDNSEVFITPTMKEVDALAEERVSIIAMDATNRERPDTKDLKEFFTMVREKYPNQLFMADCSCEEEGFLAAELGFDLIGTTMSGYTSYTKGTLLPNCRMIQTLAQQCGKPVIAEGGIWVPEQLREVMDAGAFAAVVGTAITRPMDITKHFISVLN